MTKELDFEESGQVTTTIIGVAIAIGVIVVVVVLMTVIAGQAVETTQADVNNIGNANVQTNVDAALENGFEAFSDFTNYLSIVVLAVVLSLALTLILGSIGGRFMGGGGGAGAI